MRTIRVAAAALLAAVALTLTGSPAWAAGTGDIELVPAARDGKAATSFRVRPDEDRIAFTLVNLAAEPRSARLYAASAARSEGGGIGVGSDGSARWLALPDGEITLAPNESRQLTVPLDVGALPEGREQLGAVVLEAQQGAVTVRVATLVTVESRSRLPLPLAVVLVAAACIAVVVLGLWLVRRRRRPAPESADVPVVRELVPSG